MTERVMRPVENWLARVVGEEVASPLEQLSIAVRAVQADVGKVVRRIYGGDEEFVRAIVREEIARTLGSLGVQLGDDLTHDEFQLADDLHEAQNGGSIRGLGIHARAQLIADAALQALRARGLLQYADDIEAAHARIALSYRLLQGTSPRSTGLDPLSVGDGPVGGGHPHVPSPAVADPLPYLWDGRMAAPVVLYGDGALTWHWPREGQTVSEMITARFASSGVCFGTGGTRFHQGHPSMPRNNFAERFAYIFGLEGEILHGSVVLLMCGQDKSSHIPIRADVAEALLAHAVSWRAES
jgi:hypothetical protein